MPYFDYDGIHFYYEDRGKGIPFVFQHGLSGDRNHAIEVSPEIEGYRMITLESRGHGQTSPPGDPGKYTFSDFADDVIHLTDHLEIPAFVAGGISMGAGIALNLAIRYPEKILGLVLIRPAWLAEAGPSNLAHFDLISRYLRQYGPGQGLVEFQASQDYANIMKTNPQLVGMMEEAFLLPEAAERVARYERIPNDAPSRNPEEWKNIHIATLVIGCKEDYVHPIEYAHRLAEDIPGAVFKEVPPKTPDSQGYQEETKNSIADFLKMHFINPSE